MQKALLRYQMQREVLPLLTKEKENSARWHQGEKEACQQTPNTFYRDQIQKRIQSFFRNYKAFLSLAEAPPKVGEFKQKISSLCADSHENFKHPYPLWKNKEYFVDLPFRLNEDITPTKATHTGMSPSDPQAARQECQDLLRQGLIEPTESNWACQAFYVEKRDEKLREKKRLVIDYKSLNHFLKDDKFPIPKASSLPTFIRESNLF